MGDLQVRDESKTMIIEPRDAGNPRFFLFGYSEIDDFAKPLVHGFGKLI